MPPTFASRFNAVLPAVASGGIAVLVGISSSIAVVVSAATSAHAAPAQIVSWLTALCIGMGVTSIAFSVRYRTPVVTAWSTPGAVLLATSAGHYAPPELIAAFIAAGVLVVLTAATGMFTRLSDALPAPLASAMLAGILLKFGIGVFASLHDDLVLVAPILVCYLLFKRLRPRAAVPACLLAGLIAASLAPHGASHSIDVSWPALVPIAPRLDIAACIGIAIPLYIVTMASQNLPGVAVLKAAGYAPPSATLVGGTGLMTVMLAPFGAFMICLSSITAAICTGPDALPEPSRRYLAAVAAGAWYLVVALLGGVIVTVIAILPSSVLAAIAGVALFGILSSSLSAAFSSGDAREPALVTFVVAASGVEWFGIDAAFWSLLAGLICLHAWNPARPAITPHTSGTASPDRSRHSAPARNKEG
ncbi:benzoate/H(+) symporter BenE family transporter [Burkholderia sp. NRF60-BP8]|uniref:benzoate/H(+) symporter BenE family transporter n=1 Tax=Burkholderia sp. NRF60-BP8 TaxID=1637853 RepID=UPI00076D0559|nr:benzoate/H(+) symporter BenE family transporter [Burkholderia sp. NRF60-BP8]KVA16320.1 hypothetical protein WS54_08270 [Burkholderia sp. NRF60-BP8]